MGEELQNKYAGSSFESFLEEIFRDEINDEYWINQFTIHECLIPRKEKYETS